MKNYKIEITVQINDERSAEKDLQVLKFIAGDMIDVVGKYKNVVVSDNNISKSLLVIKT